MTATYQSQNGLPPNNDDFGRKNVILSFNGQAIDSSDFEVFYLKYEDNHLGDNQTPTGQNSARSPNWFYYWRQVIDNENVLFNSHGTDPRGEVPAMAHWTLGHTFSINEIWINSGSALGFVLKLVYAWKSNCGSTPCG